MALNITWLGHSAFLVEFGSTKLLIDPFFTGNPGFGDQDADAIIKGVTHIALTHGHQDHYGDTVAIAKKTNAIVICNYDLGLWLGAQGCENLDFANTGGTLSHDDFSVTFVQAQHSSASIDENGVSHALGNANGLVFHIRGEKSLYHMGDTDIFGDMALIAELHQPQIGLVPIGDRFTMGGAVAALACRRYFNFDAIIPCHYGSFPIIDQDASKFITAMEADQSRVKAIASGESIQL